MYSGTTNLPNSMISCYRVQIFDWVQNKVFIFFLFFIFFFSLIFFFIMKNESEFERGFSKLLKNQQGLENLDLQFMNTDRNLQVVHSLGKRIYE